MVYGFIYPGSKKVGIGLGQQVIFMLGLCHYDISEHMKFLEKSPDIGTKHWDSLRRGTSTRNLPRFLYE